MKQIILPCILIVFFAVSTVEAQVMRSDEFHLKYQLKKVLAVGRHHVRSAVLTKGEKRITPYQWHQWAEDEGYLTARGAILEQEMGRFFRQWMMGEGLFDFSSSLACDSIYIYANSMRRTIDTGLSFAKGFMPNMDLEVIYNTNVKMGLMDPVFNDVISKKSDAFEQKASAEVNYVCGKEGLQGVLYRLEEDAMSLAEVLDISHSPACLRGDTCRFHFDDGKIVLRPRIMPMILGGNIYLAAVTAGDIILQYYDLPDEAGSVFGFPIDEAKLYTIGRIKDLWCYLSMGHPTVGADVCHRLLEKMKEEIDNPAHKFSYLVGHDSNLSSLTGALEMEEYTLSGTPEFKTPLGGKITFEIWQDKDSTEFVAVNYVYQNMRQILESELLDKKHPPMIVPLKFKKLREMHDGLYAMDDFMQQIENILSAYDTLDDYFPLDVNLDRKVDMLDAVDIVAALKGKRFHFFVDSEADVDGDGQLTENDAIGLVMKICSRKKSFGE